MSPFRTAPRDPDAPIEASDDVHEAVGQMVRQFADPMAFLREVVQNGIDAGATALDATLDWEGAAGDDDRGTLHASLADDGCGMDQGVIERSLLVLFRSTKEGDPSRIGRFGVGFFSVFAPGPSEVRVDTGTDPSREGLRLRLRPDFTYELESSSPRRGTTVTLSLPRTRAEAVAFAESAVEALARWCPHVEVPLHVEVRGMGAADRRTRIDRPFSVEGDARVTHREGAATYALAASPAAGAAFYNRGILLHETVDALVPGVRLKVNAPDLRHTLSRDDVRRDDAFARTLSRARALAAGPLADALSGALRRLAHACAAARHGGAVHPRGGDLVALVDLARREPFSLRAEALPWPLVAPTTLDGEPRTWASFDVKGWFRAGRVHHAGSATPLALALAARSVPVVDLGFAGGDHAEAVAGLLASCFGASAVDASARYCLPRVRPAATLPPHEARLVERVGALLGVADLDGAALGDLAGAGSDRAWAALREGDSLYDPALVVDVDEEAPFALARGRVVVLNRAHPAVGRALAVDDAGLAATALARLVLLSAGRLDDERDHALMHLAVLGAEA